MNSRRAVLLALLMLIICGCGGDGAVEADPTDFLTPAPTSETVIFVPDGLETLAAASPELASAEQGEQSPSPEPSDMGELPSPTPKQTFVPLPQTTPEPMEDGSAPTPTPEWATPYPSPTGEPTVAAQDSIQLATVVNCEEYVKVRSLASRSSSSIGTALLGTSYTALSFSEGWVHVLYNGQEGYISDQYISLSSVDLARTSALSYTMCSLNVHNMGSGSRIEEIAHIITLANVDIVCIQEVDKGTRRVDGMDCTKELAAVLGYPYYSFSHATGYEGGSFGTAIISRYPIIEAHTFPLDVAQGKERRSLGYAKILLENGAVSVFNTHLCPSSMCFKSINLASLQYELQASGVEVYTVAGDFNCSPPRLYEYLPNLHVVNMDKSTFGDGTIPKILDNILYTDGILPTEVEIIDARSTGITDHDMVFCKITIP
ncbi:MAG: SH3 domain-containing protein [Clostridia bacterium]|nr:SH3 domain-containing protein [Clostridia bacterium]